MKRRLLKLALFLVFGAIVNVAVAWGSAIWIRPPAASTMVILDLENDRYFAAYASSSASVSWLFRAERILKVNVDSVRPATGVAPPPAWSHYSRLLPNNEFTSECVEEARGWPSRALASGYRYPVSPSVFTPPLPPILVHGIQLSDWPVTRVPYLAESRALPLRPLWPGFAINTVFYAAVLWLLFAAPFALRAVRHRRRIKRGLCPKCAYDLRGSAPDSATCPECGASK